MIKLKTLEQVEISPVFQQRIRQYFDRKIAAGERVSRFGGIRREDLNKLKFYRTEPGFQMFMTRLKQLPYSRFEAVRSNQQTYFKAITRELVVDVPARRDGRTYIKPGQYNIGAYSIYISYEDLLCSDLEGFHFIPERQKLVSVKGRAETHVHARHLHHKAYFYPEEHQLANPLTYLTATCWGNFGEILSMTIESGDIPEMFRALYLYVTIQNTDSPLTNPGDLKHYERIEKI